MPLKVSAVVYEAMTMVQCGSPWTHLTDVRLEAFEKALTVREGAESVICDAMQSEPLKNVAGAVYPTPTVKRSTRGRRSRARRVEGGEVVSLHLNINKAL